MRVAYIYKEHPLFIPSGISQAAEVTIGGNLYNQNSGASITDATITVQVWSGDPCGWRDWLGQADSDSTDGLYIITLNDIPAGTELFLSTLNNNASDYVNEWWTGGTPDTSSFPCENAIPLQVPAGATSVSFTCDFHLDTGYTLSGTVTNEDHQTVSGVPIQGFRSKCWQKPLVSDTVTGSDG